MLYFTKWKIGLIVLVCVAGAVLAAPNMFDRTKVENSFPEWLQPINLGLDLQGGVYRLMEVGVDDVITDKLDSLRSEIRVSLREKRLNYRNLSVKDGMVYVRIPKNEQRDAAQTVLEGLGRDYTVNAGENGTFTIEYTEEALKAIKLQVVEQSIEVVRRRIDEMGTKEPSIQRQGDNRIILEVPGLKDPQRLDAILGKTAKMTFHLVDEGADLGAALNGRVPTGSRLLTYAERGPNGETQSLVVQRKAALSGDRLVDAQAVFQNNEPVVSFRFDVQGGRTFGKLTTENVNRRFAIVLDNEVISAPVIREPILGGSGVISGSFSVQSANDLALLLRAGALPAPLVKLEERLVGPGLGADSIEAGEFASVLGLVLVIAFMFIAYRRFGVYANVALVMNLVLLMGVLSFMGATLTLPGIAGIVLTLGMAVDANVLIFERIREEYSNGRGVMNAIESGFKSAFGTIFDSNITTLIASLLLFQFGSGPIKGFAVTLAIGIFCSMFTAIMVTRLQVALWVRSRKPKTLSL
jgi:protein-export membrane protein SecD